MGRRLIYFADKALQGLRQSPGLSALSTSTMAVVLLLMGVYVMTLQNVEDLAKVWGRAGHISCYLKDGLAAERWARVRTQLSALPGVERAELVTPKQALERFRARGKAAAELVDGVSDDVLPPVVDIYLLGGFTDLSAVAQVAAAAEHLDGVDDVDFGAEEFARLTALLQLLRYGGLLMGAFLAVATVFIVANTLRLAIYAQRDEIGILRLVGATGWFIQAPFVLEGAVWGGTAGALGAAVLLAVDRYAAPRVSQAIYPITGGLQVRFYAPPVATAMVVIGIVLGVVGSALAVRRFLDAETI